MSSDALPEMHGSTSFAGTANGLGFWLRGRVGDYQSRMEVAPAGVKVQDLGYRWGSCGKGDWVYFHWKSILLPARIAEYVVVHEIAHLHERHHTPGVLAARRAGYGRFRTAEGLAGRTRKGG